MSRSQQTASVIYRERMRPSITVFFSTALVIPASLVVFIPINPESDIPGPVVGASIGVLLYSGIIALLYFSSPVIGVTATTLYVGRAHIPREYLGTASAHTGADATAERGPRLDARSYFCIRGWIRPVLKVTLTDPTDPTPYWLFSTRQPNRLLQALQLPLPTSFTQPAIGKDAPENPAQPEAL